MDFNINCNSSLDTLVLKGENSEKKKKKYNKRKHSHKHHTEKKSNEKKKDLKHINCSDQHISQQIHVENQDFQCIINLNTTVCDHKSKHRKKCDKRRRFILLESRHFDDEKHKSKSSSQRNDAKGKDNIVPKCSRQVCSDHYYERDRGRNREGYKRSKIEHHNENKRKVTKNKVEFHHREKSKRKITKKENQRKQKHDHHKNRRSKIEMKQKCSRLLSPISSSPLKYLDETLMYEDISTTSLDTTLLEKPECYKYANHCDRRKQNKHEEEFFFREEESKLDTLIKRTKERERKLVELSRGCQPQCTSTPIRDEICISDDFPMSNSDMDISFNSRSTLVLEPHHSTVYSPSCAIEDLQNFEPEKLSYPSYSPSSPTRSGDYVFRVSNDNDFKLVNIKNEPMMNIEAYSPICSPDNFKPNLYNFIVEECVKKEVEYKTEPLFSSEISSIYVKKDNTGLRSCIKSEIVDKT